MKTDKIILRYWKEGKQSRLTNEEKKRLYALTDCEIANDEGWNDLCPLDCNQPK